MIFSSKLLKLGRAISFKNPIKQYLKKKKEQKMAMRFKKDMELYQKAGASFSLAELETKLKVQSLHRILWLITQVELLHFSIKTMRT